MNIRKYLTISLGAAILATAPVSCIHDDNWDAPEIVCTNKFDAPTHTMAQVVAMSPTTGTYTIPNGKNDPPVIFDAYVVSSDENGNFYKTISFQDNPVNPTVGLSVGLNKSMNYADFPVGSHIRIKANGLVIGKSFGTIQLGSVDPNYAIGRIPQAIIGRYISGVCAGNGLEIVDIIPTELTLAQIKNDKYINTLVKVKNVQFLDAQIGKDLMDKDASGAYVDTDRNIVDATTGSNSTVIRTDGFFRTPYKIPNKKGDITFVVSKYNSNYQNIIRGISDINLTTDLPPKPVTIFEEPFNNFTTNNWTVVDVAGPQTWGIAAFGNPQPSALMNGFGGINEDWLISKEISLEDYTSAHFTFDSWRNFSGTVPLTVLVTENYTGTPSTTTWTTINATLATSNSFINSGEQSLNAFVGKKIRIAFKYANPASGSAYSYEIDNVLVRGMKK